MRDYLAITICAAAAGVGAYTIYHGSDTSVMLCLVSAIWLSCGLWLEKRWYLLYGTRAERREALSVPSPSLVGRTIMRGSTVIFGLSILELISANFG